MNDTRCETIPELIDDAAVRFGNREAMVNGYIRSDFSEFRTQPTPDPTSTQDAASSDSDES